MKKLFIQRSDNKLVNNLIFTTCRNIKIMIGDVTNTLYETYYRYKFDAIIFMASKFNTEIFQFINEFNDIKVFIYHDEINEGLFNIQQHNLVHLVDDRSNTSKRNKHKQKNIKSVPILINKQLYDSIPNYELKNNVIVCFLDGLNKLPEQLEKFLYPHTKLPIKLFNNSLIKHYQNLGLLNEIEKAQILKQAKYYISINELYLAEALSSNCIVLDLDEIEDLIAHKYKHKKDFQTYSQFIENIML